MSRFSQCWQFFSNIHFKIITLHYSVNWHGQYGYSLPRYIVIHTWAHALMHVNSFNAQLDGKPNETLKKLNVKCWLVPYTCSKLLRLTLHSWRPYHHTKVFLYRHCFALSMSGDIPPMALLLIWPKVVAYSEWDSREMCSKMNLAYFTLRNIHLTSVNKIKS